MRWWNVAKPILIAGVACVALGLGGAFAYVKSGVYNVGASKPHTNFTWWLTNETMIHSVKRHSSSIQAPPQFTAAQVAAGFCAYESHCVACHGAAGVARQQWVSGMEPQPPYLLDAPRRFTRSELFWIVKNGIKMTGMPSWKNELSDPEIWNVVAWLDAGTKLPAETYARWRGERRCAR